MRFPDHHAPQRTQAERTAYRRAFNAWVAEETARMARQRRFLTRGRGPGVEKMIQAMLDRAWELLDAGEFEAADALLEFVPQPRAAELLNEFFKDDALEMKSI